GLIISNKWLISETGFHSTSLLALLHMMSSCAASNTLLALGLVPRKREVSSHLLARVGVLAASFTLAVATCMASLAYLPASFVQALGSTTPGLTAVLAFLIQGRREAAVTYLALVPVVVGIVLASGGEPQLHLLGLVLQLVACLARSFKTVLQAVLLTDERDRLHPMTLLAYTSALSTAMLALLTAITEPRSLHQAARLHAAHPHFAPLLALSCGLAFLANWTNFLVSKKLGALTLQVLGNFKNVVAAAAAVAVFSDPVTQLGLVGYGMTTAGVFTYS
ncbi:plastidic phosphate translocator, partial [Volvox carteri f. nagariensis]